MTRPGTPRRPERRGRRRDTGAAAVEMALVLPLLLLVLCAVIDFGRMLNAQITLTEAAREGARAAVYTSGDASTAADTRAKQVTGAKISDQTVSTTTTVTKTSSECYATVKVAVKFKFITPLAALADMFGTAPGGTYNLASTGVMTCAT